MQKTFIIKEPDPIEPITPWLLEHIEEFLTINDMPNDGCLFGWYIMQDRNLVTRLRDGKDISVRIMEDVLAFMQKPVTFVRSGDRKGNKKPLSLKPITIQRRTLP